MKTISQTSRNMLTSLQQVTGFSGYFIYNDRLGCTAYMENKKPCFALPATHPPGCFRTLKAALAAQNALNSALEFSGYASPFLIGGVYDGVASFNGVGWKVSRP